MFIRDADQLTYPSTYIHPGTRGTFRIKTPNSPFLSVTKAWELPPGDETASVSNIFKVRAFTKKKPSCPYKGNIRIHTENKMWTDNDIPNMVNCVEVNCNLSYTCVYLVASRISMRALFTAVSVYVVSVSEDAIVNKLPTTL